jgi:hypothetical protein
MWLNRMGFDDLQMDPPGWKLGGLVDLRLLDLLMNLETLDCTLRICAIKFADSSLCILR